LLYFTKFLRERSPKARKKQQPRDFENLWPIVSMSAWDEDYLHEEEPAYIEFTGGQGGQFHFGYVHGSIDYRETTRDGQPAVEFSWEGNDEMDEASGRGWAVLKGDELHGLIAFHQGDESEFVARRSEP
jgi:hypothetical protein